MSYPYPTITLTPNTRIAALTKHGEYLSVKDKENEKFLYVHLPEVCTDDINIDVYVFKPDGTPIAMPLLTLLHSLRDPLKHPYVKEPYYFIVWTSDELYYIFSPDMFDVPTKSLIPKRLFEDEETPEWMTAIPDEEFEELTEVSNKEPVDAQTTPLCWNDLNLSIDFSRMCFIN